MSVCRRVHVSAGGPEAWSVCCTPLSWSDRLWEPHAGPLQEQQEPSIPMPSLQTHMWPGLELPAQILTLGIFLSRLSCRHPERRMMLCFQRVIFLKFVAVKTWKRQIKNYHIVQTKLSKHLYLMGLPQGQFLMVVSLTHLSRSVWPSVLIFPAFILKRPLPR